MSDFSEEDIIHIAEELDASPDQGYIPLISEEEEDRINEEVFAEVMPILALRNNVLFPGTVIPITVGREKSVKLIKAVNKGNKTLGVVSQRNQEDEDPQFDDLYSIGTIAQVIRTIKMPDGNTTVILQGKRKFELLEMVETVPYFKGAIRVFEESKFVGDDSTTVLIRTVKDLANKIIKENPNIPNETTMAINNIESPRFLVNFISSNLNVGVDKKQEIMETTNFEERVMKVLEHLSYEIQTLELQNEIQAKVRKEMDRQQKEYFLQQQIRTIQDELGGGPQDQDLRDLRERSLTKKWSETVAKIFNKELDKLQRMNPQGAEYTVQLNYLDLLLDLPWGELTTDILDLKRAEKILNRDHYGLEKVKTRILEYLAVLKLKGDMKSPILCFYGPPGVGKTSLGKSIAEALGRKYVRMSLGGLHDESEIRGHRKTYIGAMPGRVMQNLKKAESSNPVFILDEIDKLGRSNHGDPSSALLEVLDPEQNSKFYDNYVETEFDLSRVMFIATANNIGEVQGPLRDRMELIEVNGYTIEEKIEIAKRHLIPRQLEEHGITAKHLSIDKKVLEKVVEEYTNESGVRGLDKLVAKIVRNRAKQIAMEEEYEVKISTEDLVKILGPGHGRTKYDNNDVAGVVTGLAWTSVGGDILFIESSLTPGKGKLTLTGNLGDVMKESAVIALEYLKSHATDFGLSVEDMDNTNVHIHVPEGATPKDGPSAGITMLTSLASSFKKVKVKKNLAMTGEITLRGDVLPVGGIKEKILAAKRAKIKEIILCEKNRQDVEEINADYIKGLTFHYVTKMEQVLAIALTKEKAK